MKIFKKKLSFKPKHIMITIIAITLLCMLTIMTCTNSESKKKNQLSSEPPIHVKFADCGWDSIRFHDAIAMYIGKIAYNIEGEEVSTTTPVSFTTVQSNDIQVNMELWADNVPDYDDALEAGNLKELGINFSDNAQGLYVPRYLIEGDKKRNIKPLAPNLKTVKDLVNYKDIFIDPEDKSKGRLYGSISGWGADEILRKKYKAYNLDKYYNYIDPGSDSALSACIAAAYEKGEPILAYNWEPNWISGKYDLILLEDAEYEKEAFELGFTAYPSMNLPIVVSNEFFADAPDFCNFLSNYHTSSALISGALAYMQDTKGSYEETAKWFLTNYEELWTTWLPEDKIELVKASLGTNAEQEKSWLLSFPKTISVDIKTPIDNLIAYQVENWSGFFNAQKKILGGMIKGVNSLVTIIPWWLLIILVGYASFRTSGSWKKALLYSFLLFFIGAIGLWDLMNQTLTIIIVSVFISLLFGLPLGILASASDKATKIVRPILDTMQTLPSFVYLIPAVMLLGIGNIPAIIATTIYALPPVVRLTSHGIRQVDREVVEAARSFGSTRWQALVKVQIPQAMPTIMTGINQTIMMAISMVVTCSMIGATGLGSEVISGINRLESGRGFSAGIAIVIIAIIIDRLTQAALKKESK